MATRDLKPGELVISETPLIIGPQVSHHRQSAKFQADLEYAMVCVYFYQIGMMDKLGSYLGGQGSDVANSPFCKGQTYV